MESPRGRARMRDAKAGGEPLVEVEGLRQIIVRAAVQPADAVARIGARGEDEDGRGFRPAQAPQDLEAVHHRQHEIEHDGIVRRALRFAQTGLAILGDIDGADLFAQRFGEGAEEVWLVFDDEDAHEKRPGGREAGTANL